MHPIMTEMKTNVAVFFGGRSVEHEISVISALQAIAAFDKEKYEIVPIYISKQGRWYTGPKLLDIRNYRDMNRLVAESEEVFMRPEYGDYNLYKVNTGMFSKRNPVVAELHVAVPVLHGTIRGGRHLRGCARDHRYSVCRLQYASSGERYGQDHHEDDSPPGGYPGGGCYGPPDHEWNSDKDAIVARVEEKLGYPVIVKPATRPSVGIEKAADRAALIEKINNAEKFSQRIIVEHMIENPAEMNCSVLGDTDERISSVLEEPIKSGDFQLQRTSMGRHQDQRRNAETVQTDTGRTSGRHDRTDPQYGVRHIPRAFLPWRREPNRRDDRRERQLSICQRDQHYPRPASFLSLGGLWNKFHVADGPVRGACPQAQNALPTARLSLTTAHFAPGAVPTGGVKGAKPPKFKG